MNFAATDWARYVADDHGVAELNLVVPGMHCGGCIAKVERGLQSLSGVVEARANLSTRRVRVRWQGALDGGAIVERLKTIGFDASPFDPRLLGVADAARDRRLLRALGVAGFAAANVMLLSVSVWAGLASDMDAATRSLFHWISALIALPAVAYAGQPFFGSALAAVKARRMNMDVPISVAVIITSAVSLYETMTGGEQVYFDAALGLLFFLLIGRFLDARMRARAGDAAANLLGLRAAAATLIDPDGRHRPIAIEDIAIGDHILVTAGARVPVDGRVMVGKSDIDQSLLSGEAAPVAVGVGDPVFAGTINLSGPLKVTATARDRDSLLAAIVRLMEAAEQGRAGYVRLADRLARAYAPLVHLVALLTFAGWLAAGQDWHAAMMAAVATLIITCPCALGLAVPVVQVVATGRLLRFGIIVKSPDALERLADIDHVLFDKTGTLSEGRLRLDAQPIAAEPLALARALARHSHHPLAKALGQGGGDLPAIDAVREIPGDGLEARFEGRVLRLGRRDFVGGEGEASLWFRDGDTPAIGFSFTDQPRDDAAATVAALERQGLGVGLLSGDRAATVADFAAQVGIGDARGDLRPAAKIAAIEELRQAGHRPLMVGDGINDAPALAAAYASMSPASASDIAQSAADIVFQGNKLAPVLEALRVARASRALVRQNFGFALAYNLIAVPLAIAGLVTPLYAALAMSASSLLVTANALRLRR